MGTFPERIPRPPFTDRRDGRRASPRHPDDLERLLGCLRDARFSDGLACPRCDHRSVQRWGTFSGRQRYRCNGCRRTFSDLTGTPAAYLKRIDVLPAYCDALGAQLTVRESARRVGIHPSTAFRWRHLLLGWRRERDDETLSGWVELGAFWLPESHKGERGRARSVGRIPWSTFYEGPRQYVIVACDRGGRVFSGVTPGLTKGPLTTWALQAALAGRWERTAPLTLTASHEARRAAMTLAGRIGATYRDVRLEARRIVVSRGRETQRDRALTAPRLGSRPGTRSLVHVGTAIPYARRFRTWLRRFRGVATRYLPNYLIWHRLTDADVRNRFSSLVLRWPRPVVSR